MVILSLYIFQNSQILSSHLNVKYALFTVYRARLVTILPMYKYYIFLLIGMGTTLFYSGSCFIYNWLSLYTSHRHIPVS
jgi:hypothetical protein